MINRNISKRVIILLVIFMFSFSRVLAQELKNAANRPIPVKEEAIKIWVNKGLLSVCVKDADLFSVMEKLAKESGIKVKVDKNAEKRITLTFKDMPFEQGLRNLIRPLNYAMIWRPIKGPQGQKEEVLVELHIFREGHQGAEAVVFGPEATGTEGETTTASKIHKRRWSEETRRRMLEKLQVRPSAP